MPRVVKGYVVMPEHFHLLISEPQDETPSTVTLGEGSEAGKMTRVFSTRG